METLEEARLRYLALALDHRLIRGHCFSMLLEGNEATVQMDAVDGVTVIRVSGATEVQQAEP